MTKYCGDIGKYLTWKAAKYGLNAVTNPIVKMGITLSYMKFELLPITFSWQSKKCLFKIRES